MEARLFFVMDRTLKASDLVGAAEIVERLGVASTHVVHVWRRRGIGFPEPVATLKKALIWSWADVEKWARATGRLDGKARNARA